MASKALDVPAIAAEAALGLKKLQAVVEAVSGSPVTAEMERLAPGLARFARDAEAVAQVAGLFGGALAALPAILGAIEALRALGVRPMDAADPVFLERERELADD